MNQAIKAVIIARRLLAQEASEAALSVELLTDVGPDAVLLRLTRTAPLGGSLPPAPDSCSLKAAAEGRVISIAGALAGKLREGAQHVTITGVGPGAVLTATKALARAAGFLSAEGVAIRAFPTFMAAALTGQIPAAAAARAAARAAAASSSAAAPAPLPESLARGVAHAQAVAAAAISSIIGATGGGSPAPAPAPSWPFSVPQAESGDPSAAAAALGSLSSLGADVEEAIAGGGAAGGRMGTAVIFHVFAARPGGAATAR